MSEKLKYALITPARNEEDFIGDVIESVISQTRHPVVWVIVSDGSTDQTDEIVMKYASHHAWIKLLQMPEHRERHFAAKANAFNTGFDSIKDLDFDIIGNLDADITTDPDYFDFLISRFETIPELGVAGTPFIEDHENTQRHTYSHRFAQLEHVSGACQLFRRKCFEEVGGYIPIKGGAIDWIAVTTARMKGWITRTFTEKVNFHHRKIGTGNNNALMARYHYGTKAYYVGGHPLWEMLRGVFLMRAKPLILGGLFFNIGYFFSFISRAHRPVSEELMAFHRKEQITRLKQLFKRN